MKYIFTREGVKEEVILERWVWVAYYKDGSQLRQFDDETGIFHQFGEIDVPNLRTFMMHTTNGKYLQHQIVIREGMSPIHFYRNLRPAGSEVWQRYYCFGWKAEIDGKMEKSLFIIGLDDKMSPMDT